MYEVLLLSVITLTSPLFMSVGSLLIIPTAIAADLLLRGIRPTPLGLGGAALVVLGFVVLKTRRASLRRAARRLAAAARACGLARCLARCCCCYSGSAGLDGADDKLLAHPAADTAGAAQRDDDGRPRPPRVKLPGYGSSRDPDATGRPLRHRAEERGVSDPASSGSSDSSSSSEDEQQGGHGSLPGDDIDGGVLSVTSAFSPSAWVMTPPPPQQPPSPSRPPRSAETRAQ